MQTQRLQAAFARRREAECLRVEKTQAVDRYFDHWGKITTRFETWTTPEYYRNAEESLRKDREKKFKDEKLQLKREKLRTLFENENIQYQEELTRNLIKPKNKKVSNEILEKIDKNFKEMEIDRRRLDLEAKLYGRWRHGVSEDNHLFESKNDHQTLAKLNWLDKQIENHMQREKDQKESEERNLKIQEEARKREDSLRECEKIRESEIKELRAIQEKHLDELKEREKESNLLHQQEIHCKQILEEIEIELENLSMRKKLKNPVCPASFNVNKIKMIIRKRFEEMRDDLKQDIDLLNRINKQYSEDEQIKHIIDKYEMQYDLEIQKQSQIEAMYESEAKHNLIKWNDFWLQQLKLREIQINNILNRQKLYLEDKITENVAQQKRLINIRETHLTAIENSNDKLKILINEQENSKLKINNKKRNAANKNNGNKSSDLSDDNKVPVNNCVLKDSNTDYPRFGRKKIAWT